MVDKYPLGYNTNFGALRDWNRYIQACKTIPASHQMAMIGQSNNPRADIDGVMRAHQEIGDPNLQWLIRIFSSKEGNWRDFNVDAYVAYCAEIHRHFPNVIFDAPSNEPGVKDNEIEAFIDNQCELIEKFAARGIKYAACCYGMGSPHHEHVTGGRYDKLLFALAKYDTAYLSEHHYAMGWLEAGSGYGYEILLDPANLSKYWLTKWPVREGHYLIRRSDYWALRCDALGIRRARVFLTESPLDQNPDAVTQLNNQFGGVWDSIRYQYGLPQYNFDLRGLNTYPDYWDETYPNLTYDEILAKLLIHFVEDCLYVDYIVAAFLFAWNQDWDIPEGTDISVPERTTTLQLLGQHAKTYVRSSSPAPTPVPTPEPEPQPEPVPAWDILRIQGNGTRVNVRTAPDANSPAVGILAAAPTVTIVAVSAAAPLDPNGMQWRQVQFNGIEGWLAFRFIVEAPQPASDPRIPLVLEALRAVRNWDIDDVGEKTERILYVDSILAQLETTA